MGHSIIKVTLDRYGHLLPGNEQEAAALLDSWLARPKLNPTRRPPGFGLASLDPGAARARWPSRSSKPVRRGNPTLGRFDSCAAPLTHRLCVARSKT